MKVRYSVDEHGRLVSRDGRVLGRLTAITLEEEGGTTGGEVDLHLADSAVEEGGEEKKNPRSPRDIVWAHYVELFDAGRQTFNPTRRRVVDQALKVRPIEVVLKAIDGLRVSPHHNGHNDQRKTYLDIRYALKGNSAKGESNEERIDRMAELSSRQPNGAAAIIDVPDWIKRNLRVGRENPDDRQAQSMLSAAVDWLRARRLIAAWDDDGRLTIERLDRAAA